VNLKKKKIILVEDEPVLCELIKTYLNYKDENLEVIGFENASEVEKYFKENSKIADLMIVDLKLPDKNGVELVRDLKSIGIEIPVVYMTGYVNQPVIEELNPDDILFTKPFPPEELYNTILELLKK